VDTNQDGGEDVENELMSRLNTLGTRDKEDLVQQFQSIVGKQITASMCEFYLEMGSWNISTALGAYYDVTSTSADIVASFSVQVIDETKHTSLSANEPFTKTWRLRNVGTVPWPNNLRVKHTKGTNFGHGDVAAVPPLTPGESTDINIAMTSPPGEGTFSSEWRLITTSGALVGCPLTVNIAVLSPSCLLSLTQRMSTLSNSEATMDDGAWTPTRPVAATPFCSPTGHGIFGGGSLSTATTTTNSLSGQLATISEVRRGADHSNITRTNLTQQIETMEEDFENNT